MNAIKRNIPNAITSLNLVFGCIALIFIFKGDLVTASWMVACAGIADFFDGMMARLLKVHSAIGKELDSLADMVSFGVVPGMMLFKLIPDEHLHWAGLCVPVFAALRLAKFNIDERQTTYFIGVPTPAISLLVSSFPLILSHNEFLQSLYNSNTNLITWFFVLLAISSSAFMVMPLPLISMKFKNMSWANNKARFILLLLSLISIIALQYVAIPVIMILYITISLFANPAKEV